MVSHPLFISSHCSQQRRFVSSIPIFFATLQKFLSIYLDKKGFEIKLEIQIVLVIERFDRN